MLARSRFLLPLAASAALLYGACGDDEGEGTGGNGGNGGSPEQTGSACDAPADCYPDLPEGEDVNGEVICLDRVDGGYCTHECETDDDCCAVEGECKTDIAQVCSPFESTGMKMCFLSCEKDDLVPPDGQNEIGDQEYCQLEAGKDFICRSSGGGSENRKICVPGDCGVGADCGNDDDCADGLECLLSFDGGYCGVNDCAGDDDCPPDARCVEHASGNACLRTCAGDSDCSFCRDAGVAGDCRSDLTFVDGEAEDVCTPGDF